MSQVKRCSSLRGTRFRSGSAREQYLPLRFPHSTRSLFAPHSIVSHPFPSRFLTRPELVEGGQRRSGFLTMLSVNPAPRVERSPAAAPSNAGDYGSRKLTSAQANAPSILCACARQPERGREPNRLAVPPSKTQAARPAASVAWGRCAPPSLHTQQVSPMDGTC